MKKDMEWKGQELKVALVHDFLTQMGGAERVLFALAEMFPDAPIYTLLYDREIFSKTLRQRHVHTSFLDRLPNLIKKRKKWLLPLFPVAAETLDLRDYDLVISSSGAWTKGIVTRLNTTHVSYIHSPMRFIWDMNGEYLGQRNRNRGVGFCARLVMNYVRLWDRAASDRPDHLIANSEYTRERIRKYYGRESEVIYPPVSPVAESSGTVISERYGQGYFLIVSRLSAYKMIGSAVEAFNKLGLPLLIVGTGEEEKRLRSQAGPNVSFAGFVPDKRLKEIYAGARAFVFPGVDDFGIAPVEAMSFGVPVIAVRQGGVKEIVEEGISGEFFNSSLPEVIADGVRRFIENESGYDRQAIRKRAAEFSEARFRERIAGYIERVIGQSGTRA